MDIREALDALAGRLQATSVRTVFGEPISTEGRTIIPVARIAYGFGTGGGRSGSQPDSSGEKKGAAGGGGGVRAVPAGVVEVTRNQVRFLRFDDWRPLAAAVGIGFGLGVLVSKWSGRR